MVAGNFTGVIDEFGLAIVSVYSIVFSGKLASQLVAVRAKSMSELHSDDTRLLQLATYNYRN